MDIELLFHHFSKPKFWIFPPQGRPPRRGTWFPELITEANIMELYAKKPLKSLNTLATPVSFGMTGWFETMSKRYLEIEEDHRLTLWEADHAFVISSKLREADGFMEKFWEARKQRRSRFGAVWKRSLKIILHRMIACHCDLDILLDPFFLYYPRTHERPFWYPGLGHSSPPSNLVDALHMTDSAEPWRNQHRSRIQDHPGSQLPRLTGKILSHLGPKVSQLCRSQLLSVSQSVIHVHSPPTRLCKN